MPYLLYEAGQWRPSETTQRTIERAERICTEYADDGYDLTLRQLYYQFVARGLIANTDRSYKQLGAVVNKARMHGLIDWEHITDRTRSPRANSHWSTPGDVIRSAAHSYSRDHWATQDTRVEVWVEKEALAGVVQRVASRWDVTYFSCRGYVSQSEQWRAGRRIGAHLRAGRHVVILHLGDHDPSGIDMTRDIDDRLRNFVLWDTLRDGVEPVDVLERFEVRRIALNMDQVLEYEPPPNPAKITDSRAASYIEVYGNESWELDALDPRTLDGLIDGEIRGLVDLAAWEQIDAEVETEREGLTALADRHWSEVTDWLGDQR